MPAPEPCWNRMTVCFKTIGCRLNQAETAQIAAQFEAVGYRRVAPGTPCDVAIINTCTITHGAERDCAKWARRLRRQGADIVVLAGCAVEHNAEQLKTRSGADLLANQTDKYRLLDLLHSPDGLAPAPTLLHKAPPHPTTPLFSTTRALVKAQDGCNFRCSYCIVPDTRGTPHSRPLSDVIADIHRLVEQGYREIVITGANLGCYQDGPHGLVDLLDAADAIPAIDRIRISSIESTTVEREIIDFMATSRTLCHFLHLPLQSGDDHVLQRMGRRYTRTAYRDTVHYALTRIPNLGLGTDIIVGFPGETDAAFANTLALARELPFSNLHVFSYSPRAGTPAATMPHPVDPAIKKQRSAELIALGKTKRHQFANSFIGQPVTTLIERITDDAYATGWSDQYLPVRLSARHHHINDIVTFTPARVDHDILTDDNVRESA